MPRVFLIHGWDGKPNNHWFPWLSLELKARGFEVNAPQLPNAANPKVQEWLEFLRDYVGKPDEDMYFVGHSLGCIAIVRYLAALDSDSPFTKGSTLPRRGEGFTSSASEDLGTFFPLRRSFSEASRKGGIRVGGCVFVAGFSGRINVPEIAEFYQLPCDAEAAKKHCNKFVMIFSDNDPFVPMEKSLEFARQLGAKTILERGKGHFTAGDRIIALPSALTALFSLSQAKS